MPHVASETKTHALKHQQARPPRTAANDRASSASPFESMIDDAAQDAKAKRSDNTERTARSQDTQAPARTKSAKDTRENAETKSADNAKATEKTEEPAKAGDAKTEAKPEAKTDAKTDAKTEDKSVEQAAADEIAAAADGQTPVVDAKPADVQATAETVAAPAVPAITVTAVTETQAAETVEATGDAPKAKPDASAAVQAGPDVTADAADAAKAPEARPADQAPAAKTPAQPHDGGKPHHAAAPEGDKQANAQARGEAPAHRGAAEAPTASTDAAVAPKADALPTQPITAPSHVSASAPATAPTVAATAAQTAAVPLPGVAVEIAGKALAGKNHFEIRLDPPELGRIEVRLDIDRDGTVTSRLIADRQDTLDLLRRDAAGLERALQDAGLKTSDNGTQFSLRDQSGRPQPDAPADAHLIVEDEALPAIDPRNYGRLTGRAGGLDIRV